MRVVDHQLQLAGIVSNGERGYHETLTVFWVHMVSRFIEPGMARLDTARTVVGRLATQRDLWKKYWTYDLMTDPKSRLEWVPPDKEASG